MKLEKCNAYNTFATMISLATIAIGAAAVAGKLMNPALGWIAVGLGSGTLLMQIPAAYHKSKGQTGFYDRDHGFWGRECGQIVLTTILATALVTVGILGGMKILCARTTGFALIGTALASWAIHSCCNPKDPIAPFAVLPPCIESQSQSERTYTRPVIVIAGCCVTDKWKNVPVQEHEDTAVSAAGGAIGDDIVARNLAQAAVAYSRRSSRGAAREADDEEEPLPQSENVPPIAGEGIGDDNDAGNLAQAAAASSRKSSRDAAGETVDKEEPLPQSANVPPIPDRGRGASRLELVSGGDEGPPEEFY